MAHWTEEKEIGKRWKALFSISVYKILGRTFVILYLIPISIFYFFYSRTRMQASREYLKKMSKYNKKIKSNFISSYRHLLSFVVSVSEKFSAWNGDIPITDLVIKTKDSYNEVIDLLNRKKGMIILFSHIGNIELLKGLAAINEGNPIKNYKINIIIDPKVNKNVNIVLSESKNNSFIDFIDASNIGPHTIISIEDKLNNGEIVAIAGDRTSNKTDKVNYINFLGEEAPFPCGAFLIPILLRYPVYYFFALRENDKILSKKYNFYIYPSKIKLNDEELKNRKKKNEVILELTKEFASIIEQKAIEYPYQWYNFHDFWYKGD
ncbi:LpxL/LpxP family acyltransferase [Brachyspira hampsonii]|nr:glycosyl transferase family 2 [Brachyspira hampsonii]MBW5389615.1 glycosyl transferase family 2 [Brachyspira hampsonii]MBW5395447.1 glycosyl transferase family 2 [Brachyspira hampsonii]OEJ20051.1 glycosyl transferase family 2 [Brachyspira hampsonii]